MTYQEYLKSPQWQQKRSERLKIDGYKCQRCGFTRALEVHHINYERLYHEDVSRDLVTLCKKCHKEVEAQKRKNDPIRTEHHIAYLAGKISKNDWRNKFYYCRHVLEPEEIANGLTISANDNLTISGPFFISCDHGCYHGDGKHGVGAVNSLHTDEWAGCMGSFFTRDEVLGICKKQIDRAEIVFAYINQRDCYGTLAEVGYAHAKGKDVVIVFSDDKLKEEMWFVDKMQLHTGNISNRWINQQLLSRIMED